MPKGGVIVEPHAQSTSDWIVPRRVMCAFFWVGIILLFTGIILLVTSKHKEEFYQSWGAILLGLGFCLLLICFILCMHAYCIITVSEDEQQPQTSRQSQQQQRPQDAVRKKAPLKPPPNFKIPSNRQRSLIDKKINLSPGRLKTINENGSPNLGLNRNDSFSSKYGSTSSRADHVRTCVSGVTSLPPAGKVSVSNDKDDEIVHYMASPQSVILPLGNKDDNKVHNDLSNNNPVDINCEPKLNNHAPNKGCTSDNCDQECAVKDAGGVDNFSFFVNQPVSGCPDTTSGQTECSTDIPQAHCTPGHIIVHNTPVFKDYHFDVSLLEPNNPSPGQDGKPLESHGSPCSLHKQRSLSRDRTKDITDTFSKLEDKLSDYSINPENISSHYVEHFDPFSDLEPSLHHDTEQYHSPECTYPSHTLPQTVQETHVYSRPVVTARVTQLPEQRSDDKRYLPNGAPPQLSIGYNRQYPISAVHAYPIRYKNPHIFAPLSISVDEDEPTPLRTDTHKGHRPLLTPIAETLCDEQMQLEDHPHCSHHPSQPQPHYQRHQHARVVHPVQYRRMQRNQSGYQHQRQLRVDIRDATQRPFSRDNPSHERNREPESNLVQMAGSGVMDRGLNNSANVYLNPDEEFDSKMSIYDNLNYIRI